MSEQHIDILDEREQNEDAALETFLKELKWQDESIDDCIFDVTKPDIPVSYTYDWRGVIFSPLGGLTGLNGRPGNGKTMTFSMMIAAALRGEYCGLRCLIDNATCLYVDTEMEVVNHQRTVRRIYDMVGWPQMVKQERFNSIMLREVNDASARWRKVLKAIWQYKPNMVFLDGMIDIVNDFNDNKECQERIYQCMAVASHYNISVWCLLHLNPGSEKAVGHLGSFLERKATDIFVTSKDEDTQTMNVKHVKQRLKKVEDVHFRVEDDERHYGHPVILGEAEVQEAIEERLSEEPLVMKMDWGPKGFSFSEISDFLKPQGIRGVKKIYAEINLALKNGIIRQEPNKRYYLNNPQTNQDTQMSLDEDNSAPF